MNGKAAERRTLIEELRLLELTLDHWIIRTAAADGYKPNEEWIAGRAACVLEISACVGKLQAITKRPRDKTVQAQHPSADLATSPAALVTVLA
jgi:hypothetical protein